MDYPVEYCCHLDSQPDHLVPEHRLRNWWIREPGCPLFWNSNCQLTNGNEIPQELMHDTSLTSGFAPRGDMAWVRNSVTGTLQPYWMDSEMQFALRDIRDGKATASLSAPFRRCLATAEVLVSSDHGTIQAETASMLSRAAYQLRHRGFAPVSCLIHPFQLSALRRYYRKQIRLGKMPLGDSQSSQRYHAHNESVARFFHHQLTKAVSLIVGRPVKPSYVFFASYQEGASLAKHIDRPQCEFSMTFCLDYSPEPERQTPWPIQLHTPGAVSTIYQSLGDGLVYLGCEVPHSRGVLPTGHTSSSIFFHYVPEGFSGPLD